VIASKPSPAVQWSKQRVIGGQVGIADACASAGAILGRKAAFRNKVIREGRCLQGARPIKQYLKELAVLARLAKKS
jgi:UDP-3-O-[3-hydroxymyristoyl] glucosamine N-acyltransferase